MQRLVMQDPRLPVVLGAEADAKPDDCVLALPPPGHAVGCACCGARDPLAVALARAYLALMRGERPPFSRVLLIAPEGAATRVASVLAADPVSQARFRYGDVTV